MAYENKKLEIIITIIAKMKKDKTIIIKILNSFRLKNSFLAIFSCIL